MLMGDLEMTQGIKPLITIIMLSRQVMTLMYHLFPMYRHPHMVNLTSRRKTYQKENRAWRWWFEP